MSKRPCPRHHYRHREETREGGERTQAKFTVADQFAPAVQSDVVKRRMHIAGRAFNNFIEGAFA